MGGPGRSYEFDRVCGWFAERADLVLVMFDTSKVDIGDEMKAASSRHHPRTTPAPPINPNHSSRYGAGGSREADWPGGEGPGSAQQSRHGPQSRADAGLRRSPLVLGEGPIPPFYL